MYGDKWNFVVNKVLNDKILEEWLYFFCFLFLKIMLKLFFFVFYWKLRKKDGYMYLIIVFRKLFIKISLVFYCYFYICNVVIF